MWLLSLSGVDDHPGAIRAIATAHHPSINMDTERVGIWGHSAGGYASAHALLKHPEFCKVAVSSAGNHDHRMDKSFWNEQVVKTASFFGVFPIFVPSLSW